MAALSAAAQEHFTLKNGKLDRPAGYREWVYVGTPVTPNELKQWFVMVEGWIHTEG